MRLALTVFVKVRMGMFFLICLQVWVCMSVAGDLVCILESFQATVVSQTVTFTKISKLLKGQIKICEQNIVLVMVGFMC